MDQKLQSFNFFAKVPLAEKGQSTTGGSPLNQLDISSFIILGSKFYAVSKKNNCINVLELTTDNAFGLRLIGQITPYNERLDFVEKCIVNTPQGKQQYLVTYGLDNESQGPSQGLKATYVKFWEHEENISLDDLKNLRPKKSILVGKISVPLLDCFYFAVSSDLSAFALASKDGVHIYKSKNVLTDNPKESVLLVEKGPARFIGFAVDPNSNNIGLYVGTSTTVLSFPNITKEAKKRLAHLPQGSFKHFDINQKGELYCITDANVIQAFNLFDTVESWPYEEDKQMIKCFGNNYLIASIKVKRDEEVVGFRMIIYDLANQVLGYNPTADLFPGIIDIFVSENNAIYAVIINQKGEKLLNKFVEEDNTKKLEKILTKNCFDIAYRFASNQQYDPMLLAEISLCNANHHYAKKDYQKAINEYKKTAGTTQPSSVIMKFLDVSQIDYLIQYLEHIHEKKLANKDHTALLLNCYVKQKNMEKFEEFLNNLPSFKSEIFDTKAAVKECRDLKHIDLALKLALQCDHEDLYIRILIEDKKDYLRALEQIRQTRSLENKIRYIREYGQTFMKNEPAKTLDLLQKMITLSSFRRVSFASDRPLTPEERDIFEYLNLPESDKERLNLIIFPRPDEFFHFFVGKNQYLENYLEFLKNHKTLALEKPEKLYPIFHKMFEYYLEQYSNYKNLNAEILKYRESADDTFIRLENKIIHLLEAPEHDKKYDKNHILVLFKMYKFGPGVVILCRRMGLREELLDYYIEERAFEEIIDLCKNFGGNEINLWVQALKFFSKLDKKERSFIDERGQPKTRITQALDSIQNIEALSPLLVLNILGKARNLSLGEVKRYFQNRLVENTMDAQKNWRTVQDQTRETESNKAEYKRLKTQAKKFVSESCSANCGEKIMLHDNENAVYFLCGCTYHQNCLEETEEAYYECRKCADDRRTKTNIVNDLKAQSGNSTQFFEKLEGSKNKFDVISEFMGKGLFGTFQTKEKEEEDL